MMFFNIVSIPRDILLNTALNFLPHFLENIFSQDSLSGKYNSKFTIIYTFLSNYSSNRQLRIGELYVSSCEMSASFKNIYIPLFFIRVSSMDSFFNQKTSKFLPEILHNNLYLMISILILLNVKTILSDFLVRI